MTNTYRYTVTNKLNGDAFISFEGTELELALKLSDKKEFLDIGYPADIISLYKAEIIRLKKRQGSTEHDEEMIEELNSGIKSINEIVRRTGLNSVVLVDDYKEGKLKARTIHDINQDYRIERTICS